MIPFLLTLTCQAVKLHPDGPGLHPKLSKEILKYNLNKVIRHADTNNQNLVIGYSKGTIEALFEKSDPNHLKLLISPVFDFKKAEKKITGLENPTFEQALESRKKNRFFLNQNPLLSMFKTILFGLKLRFEYFLDKDFSILDPNAKQIWIELQKLDFDFQTCPKQFTLILIGLQDPIAENLHCETIQTRFVFGAHDLPETHSDWIFFEYLNWIKNLRE